MFLDVSSDGVQMSGPHMTGQLAPALVGLAGSTHGYLHILLGAWG